ncbi:MAG TPA: hypothetical protein VF962_14355, partial [Gemmatimonadaceae bacterium]
MISRILTLLFALPLLAAAQSSPQPPGRLYLSRAAHVVDGRSDVVQNDVAVIIEGERIVAVGPRAQIDPRILAAAYVVDLGGATILPGLIDNHTHVLLQGDITSADYDEQLLKESTLYRAIRATAA